MKIAIAGTGYVGLSISVLLAQANEVVALDIVAEKVDLINRKQSPIEDKVISANLQNWPDCPGRSRYSYFLRMISYCDAPSTLTAVSSKLYVQRCNYRETDYCSLSNNLLRADILQYFPVYKNQNRLKVRAALRCYRTL